MPFRTSLVIRTDDGWRLQLVEPLIYDTDDGRTVVMPVGSTSDGASSPRELWAIVPPFGVWWAGSVLHDGAYRNQLTDENGVVLNLSKTECDDLFREAMESLGVSPTIRAALYRAVSLGGWHAFHEDRERQ